MQVTHTYCMRSENTLHWSRKLAPLIDRVPIGLRSRTFKFTCMQRKKLGGSNSSSFVGAEAVAKTLGKTASHVSISEEDCRNAHFF
jgi:hypothetical protein